MPDSEPKGNAMVTPTQVPAPDFGQKTERPKRVLWKWSALIVAIGLLYLSWQCGSALYFGSKLADAAARRFHDQLDAGQFEQICQEADEALSQEGPQHDEFIKVLEAVHHKLGDVIRETQGKINVNVNTQGTFVTVDFFTQFATDQAHETFTWRKSGNTLKLYGYYVQSKAFLK
jgi:hypothetical protein